MNEPIKVKKKKAGRRKTRGTPRGKKEKTGREKRKKNTEEQK